MYYLNPNIARAIISQRQRDLAREAQAQRLARVGAKRSTRPSIRSRWQATARAR